MIDPPKAPRLLMILIFWGSTAASCQKHPPHEKPKAMTESLNDLAELQRELQLKIPPGVRVVGIKKTQGGEYHVRAKLLMSRAQWQEFLKNSPVPVDGMDLGTGGFLGQDGGWWDPHAAKALRTGQAQRDQGRFINIGFDDSAPDDVSVYVVHHSS